MKSFCLQCGANHIDNQYGHISGIKVGRICCVEAYSQSPGTITITRRPNDFSVNTQLAAITIGADGCGMASDVDKMINYGDVITVSGIPVEGNNKYRVVCFYE